MSGQSTDAVWAVDVVRDAIAPAAVDHVAVERPLEVRLNGTPFAVIMRTPGSDRALTLGFLFSEGIVTCRADVERIDVVETEDIANAVFVRSRADAVANALAERRQVTMNSSCGMCGRRTLGSLAVDAPTAAIDWRIERATLASLPDRLGAAQPAFAQTGGLHAAACFAVEGVLEASAEDVGLHNAVDKVVGRLLDRECLPLSRSLLLVSGRASFEIVQKAWLAGVPLVAAISAPSSLAIETAQQAGITLIGFLRESRFNVYTHAARVRL
jgi:FdhD protein